MGWLGIALLLQKLLKLPWNVMWALFWRLVRELLFSNGPMLASFYLPSYLLSGRENCFAS
jgi:hypothetical protein